MGLRECLPIWALCASTSPLINAPIKILLARYFRNESMTTQAQISVTLLIACLPFKFEPFVVLINDFI